MPFTPFHLGPATILKAIAGGSFSITIFGCAQVAMDLQPLVHLLRGGGIQHGFSHTLLGATLIGAATTLLGRPLCQWLLGFWEPDPADRLITWLRGPKRIGWGVAVSSAFLGTYSHVLLDSLVHSDVLPFAPFSDANPLLGLQSMGALHLVCVGAGVLGLIGMMIVGAVEADR